MVEHKFSKRTLNYVHGNAFTRVLNVKHTDRLSNSKFRLNLLRSVDYVENHGTASYEKTATATPYPTRLT